MENQNIQWENWNEQPQENNEQPQINWGEPTQEENIPTWDNQPQQNNQQPQINWGEPTQEENIPTWDNQPQQKDIPTGDEPSNSSLHSPNPSLEVKERKWSCLGLLPKLKIEALIFKLDHNDSQSLREIETIGYKGIDKDGKYQIPYQDNTELANTLHTIKEVINTRGMELQHSYLYKNSPNESVINVSRGEYLYNYIYFLQANSNSGDVILDFSALNGPSEQVIEASPGLLLLLPGWVPYRISKNLSNKDMVAISGRVVAPTN